MFRDRERSYGLTAGVTNPQLAGNMLAVIQRYIALGDTLNETAFLIPFPCKPEEVLKT